MCLVDVHLAPFVLRLSRLRQPFRGWASPEPKDRWEKWRSAFEQNPYIRCTLSKDNLYVESMDDLIKGYQGMLG
jgi:hypothetical protein